ncbi:MAG: GNAT family N-acetyltransferase [Verrucomicrobia bacterium]|nr:GNAT family N-acetyltransferase [Verrucomicrobiota bacterium]
MLAIPESISNDGRIALVPVEPGHAERLYQAIVESTREFARWMEWFHPGYQIEETRRWIATRRSAWEEGSDYAFIILEKGTANVLGGGSVGVTSPLHRIGTIGYWIRSSRTKQGFASEAAGLLARFGFSHLGLIRIEIVVAVGNTASIRVAEKAGAFKEGRLRNRLLLRGKPKDAYLFSLIPTDL